MAEPPWWKRGEGKGNVIASWSPEAFLAGDRARFTDPEQQAKMDRHRETMRLALDGSVQLFEAALAADSENTSRRLREIWDAALAGSPEAMQMFIVMWAELAKQALQP